MFLQVALIPYTLSRVSMEYSLRKIDKYRPLYF